MNVLTMNLGQFLLFCNTLIFIGYKYNCVCVSMQAFAFLPSCKTSGCTPSFTVCVFHWSKATSLQEGSTESQCSNANPVFSVDLAYSALLLGLGSLSYLSYPALSVP